MSDTPVSVVDSAALRAVMSNFCTGVAVVTAWDGTQPLGFTCQSLVSVSLEPPLVSFCPAKSSTTWPRIRPLERLCINVLAHDQRDLCLSFAKSGAEKFDGIEWSAGGNGAPELHGALAYVEATVVAEHEAGDHTIVVAEVTDLRTHVSDAPLVFFRGEFGLPDPLQAR